MHDTYGGRRKPACITGDRVKVNDRDWPRLIARIIYQAGLRFPENGAGMS